MPLTSLSVSSKAFSGQMRPSKPSGMPMTFHPYLMMAALVAARMTALRPGASPPPVPIPMQRMSDMDFVVRPWSLVDGRLVDDRRQVWWGNSPFRSYCDSRGSQLTSGHGASVSGDRVYAAAGAGRISLLGV